MNLLSESLLKKLTVVIISKDRINELENVISYWLKTSCKLVVIHDSKEPLNSSYTNKNFVYIRSEEPYLNRLAIAENFIATPYSVICNDDEIFLVDPLLKFVNFLDSNKDIEAVGGQVIAYSWAGNKLLASNVYPYLQNFLNKNKSSISRIRNTFETKNVMDITLIYRSDEFKQIINCCKNFPGFTVPVMGEMMFAFFSSYYCRSVRLVDVYWMRNWFTPMHNYDNWDRGLTWNDWCRDPKFQGEVRKWIIDFELLLSNKTSISHIESKEIVEYLLNWKSNSGAKVSVKRRTVHTRILNALKKFIPGLLIWKLKRLLPFTRKYVMPDLKTILEQQKSAYSISMDDVERFKLFAIQQKSLYK
jgi:glycosyltransferase domain-containing protein